MSPHAFFDDNPQYPYSNYNVPISTLEFRIAEKKREIRAVECRIERLKDHLSAQEGLLQDFTEGLAYHQEILDKRVSSPQLSGTSA